MASIALRLACLHLAFLLVGAQEPEISLMGNEMDKNREYQCVASCFKLNDQGNKNTGKSMVPECVVDYRSISLDCHEPTKNLGLIVMDFGRYWISSDKKNWHEASRICRTYSMQLAGLETKDEIQSVAEKAYVNDTSPPAEGYWMSLCDLVEDGKWYWAHSGEDLTYSQWDAGEPNDVGKVPQRCVELKMASDKSFKWADRDCMDERKFICEMPEICFRQYCNAS
ncbi:C-type lectin 37Db-like [Neocloeon triangulifer]|uniref:C-type lectin 37Db-like n=1 Tax=Neocloeon triangulifer TaxID=2078957 RepID=UPI00286EB6B3|nr:C-type lectin 37Db-like [Neocloeon triangulifer]